MIDNADLHLDNGETRYNVRVKIKDSGYVGAKPTNEPWTYYPPHRIQKITSTNTHY